MGTALTNHISTQEEIKSRLKSGNACCHSVQNLLSSSLLPKNVKIHRTTVLPVVYGCETWSLTLREDSRLGVFENRVLRRIFGPKRDKVTGKRRKLHNEELKYLCCSSNIIREIKSRKIRLAGHSTNGERRGVYRVLAGNLVERDRSEDPGLDRRITLRWLCRKWDG